MKTFWQFLESLDDELEKLKDFKSTPELAYPSMAYLGTQDIEAEHKDLFAVLATAGTDHAKPAALIINFNLNQDVIECLKRIEKIPGYKFVEVMPKGEEYSTIIAGKIANVDQIAKTLMIVSPKILSGNFPQGKKAHGYHRVLGKNLGINPEAIEKWNKTY